MPSILYSTTCYIKNDLYRLRIYIDEQTENDSLATDSLDFTSIDIPIHRIKPSLTRLNFQLLDEKKINNNIPQTIPLNHLLNVKQTISPPKNSPRSLTNSLQITSSPISSISIDSRIQSQQSSQSTLTNHSLKSSQFSFARFFSLSTNTGGNSILLSKTLIKISYVDVSNSIRWNIKTLELEMDTEDIANELYSNLNLCLSTLKQRPRRLLAFVNPLSGKGTIYFSLYRQIQE